MRKNYDFSESKRAKDIPHLAKLQEEAQGSFSRLHIRRARKSEAEALSDLAMESKAFWGYSPDFIESCREELSVSAGDLRDRRRAYFVAEVDGEIVGFYGLEQLCAAEQELEALFVAPPHIGEGIGRSLMVHAAERAASSGANTLVIQGDPHADGFYRGAGARRVGERPSGSIPGRKLPVYRLTLQASRKDAARSDWP